MIRYGDKGYIAWKKGSLVEAVIIKCNIKSATLNVVLLEDVEPNSVWKKGDIVQVFVQQWQKDK